MAVIFDIDGTLADLTHRRPFISGSRKDYDAFFARVDADQPYPVMVDLAGKLRATYGQLVLVSGRPEKTRAATEAWMARHGVLFEGLYMRADGDFRADYIVKSQILDGVLQDGFTVDLVVDDRPSVVAMWRERGLTCLQCREWDEEAKYPYGHLTVMVGPSGAGKTTWLGKAEDQRFIVSSDALRAELCGDFRDQSKNDQVFGALHGIVRARLGHGLKTIVDATNIRRKDRVAVAALAAGNPVRYIVIDRPLEAKRASGGWRNSVNGFDLIGRHDQTFKSNLKDILAGDCLPNVEVMDLRGAL